MQEKLSPKIYSEHNFDDKKRRVGFEIETSGLSINTLATHLQCIFGGDIEKKHKNLSILSNTELGSFKIELDANVLKKLSEKSKQKQENHANHGDNLIDVIDWEGVVENLIPSNLLGLIPIEIVTPPVAVDEITQLDKMIDVLKQNQAYDTKKSILTAFGLHINPDVPTLEPMKILAFMTSFILLNDWLKEIMPLDLSRKFSGFINDYPRSYCKKILSPAYQPNLDELIDDYLAENESRNRALDMLPLFAFLKKDIVQQYPNIKINPRPTFHYRLANSQFSKPGWNLALEWERWLYIEALAKNTELRAMMASDYLRLSSSAWKSKVGEYIA
ncbi:MAG: amidoligase family protein [Legionellaceae bacterium]|nr:amidoligase family protein [Legionellaceae bacterium]